jgi:prespore-specific regulator
MSAIRQDAWTEQDDVVLAEVTLRHIREGGTQLSAFAEVGLEIGRTQAACGFRWNSYLRKQYETEIRQAKAQRQKVQHERRKFSLRRRNDDVAFKGLAPGGAERFRAGEAGDLREPNELLVQMQHWFGRLGQLQVELQAKSAELDTLRKENEDYKNLLQILDRARSRSAQPLRQAHIHAQG